MSRFSSLLLVLIAFIAFIANSAPVTTGPVPGADVMVLGFDQILGIPTGLPVLEFTYNDNQVFSPDGESSISWSVPDQIYPSTTDTSRQAVVIDMTASFESIYTTYMSSFGLSVGFNTGNISATLNVNKELYNAHYQMTERDQYMGYSYIYYSLYELVTSPFVSQNLHPWFQGELSSLPPTISSPSDQAAYDQFICRFGTDYIESADFGIRVDVSQFANNSVVETWGDSWTSLQMSLSFHFYMFSISPSIFTNRSQINVNQAYSNFSTIVINFIGGDPLLQSNATLVQWVQSAFQYPHYLNTTLQPLYTLAGKYPQTQQTLEQQRANYLKTGKLTNPCSSYKKDEVNKKNGEDVKMNKANANANSAPLYKKKSVEPEETMVGSTLRKAKQAMKINN